MQNSVLHKSGGRHPVTSDNWLHLIKKGNYRAIIFDCDGTLVDSAEVHFGSFQAALRKQGHEMDRSWYNLRTGMDRFETIKAFAAQATSSVNIERAAADSIKAFIANSGAVQPISETAHLVRALAQDYAMAVGTNAEADVARASLQAAGLLPYFSCVASVSDGLAPKPAPDIFHRARLELGFSKSETLVFEDSPEGVQASLRAGLDVVQLQ